MNQAERFPPQGESLDIKTIDHRARFSTWSAVIFSLVATSTGLIFLLAGRMSGSWQMYTLSVVCLILAGLGLAAFVKSRRGNPTQASGLIIVGISILVLTFAVLIANSGLIIGLIAAIIILVIATQTLPQRIINRAVLSGLILGLVAGLLDYLNLPTQVDVPAFGRLLIFISGICVLAFIVFLVYQYRDLSLTNKFLIAFLMVTLLSVGAIALLNQRTTERFLSQNVGIGLHNIASTQALVIGNELGKQIDLLNSLSSDRTLLVAMLVAMDEYKLYPISAREEIKSRDQVWREAVAAGNTGHALIQDHLKSNISDQLNLYKRTNSNNVEIILTDKFGALVAATDLPPDYDQSRQIWWRGAYNGGDGDIYISWPELEKEGDVLRTILAIPVYNPDTGEILGVLRTTYRLTALASILGEVELGKTGNAELIFPDSGGLHSHVVQNRIEPIEPDVFNHLRISTGRLYSTFPYQNDRLSLISQAPVVTSADTPLAYPERIAELGWRIVVYQEREEALAPVRAQTRANLLLAVMIVSIVSTVGILIAFFLSKPITQLTAAAVQVREGDLSVRAPVTSSDEVGELAASFNSMTARLSQILDELEQRVEERTRDLEQRNLQLQVAAEVARDITATRDLEELFNRAVNLIRDRFGFYHAGIFLVPESASSEADKFAVLRAATGRAGREMLRRGHQLQVGKTGIVGFVAEQGEPRVASDVGEDAVHFKNPFLPDTRSEAAVPLKAGERVIGVLDVQSVEPSAFDNESLEILQIMADQLTIAIENSQLLQEVQENLEELEIAYRRYSRQAWERFSKSQPFTGFEYNGLEVTPILEDEDPGQSGHENGTPTRIPLTARGEIIGSLDIWPREGNLTADEIALLTNLSSRISQVMESARLFQEAQARAAREQLAGEVTSKIRSSLDIDRVLQTAVREIGDKLRVAQVEVHLGTDIGQVPGMNTDGSDGGSVESMSGESPA